MPHSTIATISGRRLPSAWWRSSSRCRLPGAVLHREGAGDAEGIEAVQVAAGRQDRRACAAGRRRAPGGRSGRPARAGCPASSWSSASSGRVGQLAQHARSVARRRPAGERSRACAVDQRLDRRALGPGAMRGLGDRQQQVDALLGDGGSPTTCRPCGISVYSSSRIASPSRATCASASSSQAGSAGARSSAAACAWISVGERRALGRRGVGRQRRASARSRP